MKPIAVLGGGIAGLRAALTLARGGKKVVLLEKSPRLGGRADTFRDRTTGEEVDNGQHVILGCCTTLLQFIEDIGASDELTWHEAYTFLEEGGARHTLRPTRMLPAPLHYLPSLLRFGALTVHDRRKLAFVLLRMMRTGARRRHEAQAQPFARWLDDAGASSSLVRRFFDPILVAAVNEELNVAAAAPCFQVFLEGFLPHRDAARLGVARRHHGALFANPARRALEAADVDIRVNSRVVGWEAEGGRLVRVRLPSDESLEVEGAVCALPPKAAARLGGTCEAFAAPIPDFAYSPITDVQMWWDRPVTTLPFGALLESPVQWFFTKEVTEPKARDLGARQRVRAVISASRDLTNLRHPAIIELCRRELTRFFPEVADARLVHGLVVTERRATISVTPEWAARRPGPNTKFDNLFLAGDWTDVGWPPTMEGAARSGQRAANLLLGRPEKDGIVDLSPSLLARLLMR